MRPPTNEEKAMLIGADLLVDYPPAYEYEYEYEGEFEFEHPTRDDGIRRQLRVTEEEEAVGPPVNEYAFFSIVAATTVVSALAFDSMLNTPKESSRTRRFRRFVLLSLCISSLACAISASFNRKRARERLRQRRAARQSGRLVSRTKRVRVASRIFMPWEIRIIQIGGIDIVAAAKKSAPLSTSVVDAFQALSEREMRMHAQNASAIIVAAVKQAGEQFCDMYNRCGALAPPEEIEGIKKLRKLASRVGKAWKRNPPRMMRILSADFSTGSLAEADPQLDVLGGVELILSHCRAVHALQICDWFRDVLVALSGRCYAMLTSHAKTRQRFERMCAVCHSDPVNVAFSPCTHAVCCSSCAMRIQAEADFAAGAYTTASCPVCRASIARLICTPLYSASSG